MFPANIMRGQALAGIQDGRASGYPIKAFGYDKSSGQAWGHTLISGVPSEG